MIGTNTHNDIYRSHVLGIRIYTYIKIIVRHRYGIIHQARKPRNEMKRGLNKEGVGTR